ncbi:MAG TPA: MaoC/PaaZ C-terminal domain-containing protein [Pseudolysinimonas sp.]|nr:MaoC/PaaZ C-terminal domain-containing protein [Pseudolysinimonas sp.]
MSAPTLDQERLLAWPFRDVRLTYTDKDTILYALSVGLGADPTDPGQLRYVYEKDLVAFPTMLNTLGMYDDDDFVTDPGVGIDLPKMLHTEMGLTFHAPMPATGEVVSRLSIDRLIDRGEGRGAILDFSRAIRSAESGELIATEMGSFFMRGNGGFGGSTESRPRLPDVPDGQPHLTTDLETPRSAALLYRLLGDRNPIHVDPAVAASVGFPAPILHGACTFGISAHGVVRALLGYRAERLRRIAARFSAPVLPGDTLHVEVWDHQDGNAAFRVRVQERDLVVVDNGVIEYE